MLFLLVSIAFNPSTSWGQQQAMDYEQNVNTAVIESAAETILVLGDSLAAAYGIDREKGWVSLLAKTLANSSIVNASISGETTSGGLQRLPALMQKHRPDVLVIELGANDALRGQNLKTTKQNLQNMIDLCQQADKSCRTILLGVQLPTNYGPAYDALFQKMYRDLAQNNNLSFDPFFIEDVALDPGLMQADGLHPNTEAQPIILKRVLPLFKH